MVHLVLSTLVLLSAPAEGSAQAFSFATSLLEEGDHYRAIGEFKRALFLGAAGEEASRARYLIGVAYLRGEQFEAAISHYRQAALLESALRQDELLLQVGYAYYLWGKHPDAYRELSGWLASQADPPGPSQLRARYLLGWTSLAMGLHQQAAREFERLPDFGGRGQLIASSRELERLPYRSPWVAGLLALIPGAGHVYIGQPLVGLAAFSWNALFGFAVFDSIRRANVASAVVFGLLEALWYSGNVFGAVSGAHKFNRDTRENALEALRRSYDDRPESWPPTNPPSRQRARPSG